MAESALASKIIAEYPSTLDASGRYSVADARRRRAIEALKTAGLPTTRDENWKYANLRSLERARFAPLAAQDRPMPVSSDLPAAIDGYARYTFVDGNYVPGLSNPRDQAGVTVRSLRDTPDDLSFDDQYPDARFALVNSAFATDGLHVVVAPGGASTSCLEVVFIATADAREAASYPRLLLNVGARAKFGLIERHISVGSQTNLVNAAVQIRAETGACVQHYRVQQVGARASWIDTLTASVANDSRYLLHLINLGALSSRSTMRIRLEGRRADVRLHAVSVADHQQVHDAYAIVDHSEGETVSRQVFRGIGAGRARSSFNSKVVVRQGARGADSYQSLRGLLAGVDAEIDVRPQLEIYTDDVRCAHGATAGKLDETMLFYLLSRGLDRATAQRLLKWAFLEDVVAKIEVAELRRQIEESLAGHLNEAPALEARL